MAKQKGNVVTHGLSGKIGDLLVFRQVDGKTVVSKIPERPKTVSDKQKEHRERFQRATFYAKSAVDAPETKELYTEQAKRRSGKSASLTGDRILITASDLPGNITADERSI
jgi:hypothetical protein